MTDKQTKDRRPKTPDLKRKRKRKAVKVRKVSPVATGEKSKAPAPATSQPAPASSEKSKTNPIEVPREFEQPPKTVSEEGLVHMPEDRKARLVRVPLHYCGKEWFGPNRLGGFSCYKDSQAAALLSEYGFHRTVKNDAGTAECERALLWLMQNHHVRYAGPLAGWPTGVYQMGPTRVLVTEQIQLVKPTPGEWNTIRALIEELLADDQHDQVTVLYQWAAKSLQSLCARMAAPGKLPFQQCPALAVFGPRGSGKSALLSIVLQGLFGQIVGDPMAVLLGNKFNEDLLPSVLLMLDDKGASNNLEERRERADALKALIWTQYQRIEGKHTKGVMLELFWRLVIGGNSETSSSLNILPTLNDSLRDKIILLHARQAESAQLQDEARLAWIAALQAELPAFAHWLLNFKLPKKWRGQLDKRTGVLNFWHPDLEAALLEKQPECKALEVINELFPLGWLGPEKDSSSFSSTQFYKEIRKRDEQGHFENLFNNIDKCGRILSELAKSMPARFERVNHSGVYHYRIHKLPVKPEL